MENNTPARKLKELPKLPKKGKIYEMYGKQFSNNTMKINLNTLIEDFKTRTQMHVSKREVPKPVWIEWIKSFCSFVFSLLVALDLRTRRHQMIHIIIIISLLLIIFGILSSVESKSSQF